MKKKFSIGDPVRNNKIVRTIRFTYRNTEKEVRTEHDGKRDRGNTIRECKRSLGLLNYDVMSFL